jgi:hypothetical protein
VEGVRRLVPAVPVPIVELGHQKRRENRSSSTSVLGRARGLSLPEWTRTISCGLGLSPNNVSGRTRAKGEGRIAIPSYKPHNEGAERLEQGVSTSVIV